MDKHASMSDFLFAHIAKMKQPDNKVIDISGDVNQLTVTATAAIDIFLRKPFTRHQLNSAVS